MIHLGSLTTDLVHSIKRQTARGDLARDGRMSGHIDADSTDANQGYWHSTVAPTEHKTNQHLIGQILTQTRESRWQSRRPVKGL